MPPFHARSNIRTDPLVCDASLAENDAGAKQFPAVFPRPDVEKRCGWPLRPTSGRIVPSLSPRRECRFTVTRRFSVRLPRRKPVRILVLGDIHSNWAALSAVAEAESGAFDACLVTGDLVDYGTDPLPCVRWVRDHATAVVRGNHDHAVAQRVAARGGAGLKGIAAAARPLHWQVLGREEMRYLARLPVTNRLNLGNRTFFLVHATPRDPMDEYLSDDAGGWENRLEFIEADFVLVGHTHVGYVLELGNRTIVNPGSVGQPRDGDPRASYAIIENGNVELRRIAYDIDAAVAQMDTSGLSGEIKNYAERTLRGGGG